MGIQDWKRVGEAERDEQQLSQLSDLVIRIEVRVESEKDYGPILTEAKRVAVKLHERGHDGVWEAQWCSSSARISLARLP